jgi:hypothetical protein
MHKAKRWMKNLSLVAAVLCEDLMLNNSLVTRFFSFILSTINLHKLSLLEATLFHVNSYSRLLIGAFYHRLSKAQHSEKANKGRRFKCCVVLTQLLTALGSVENGILNVQSLMMLPSHLVHASYFSSFKSNMRSFQFR